MTLAAELTAALRAPRIFGVLAGLKITLAFTVLLFASAAPAASQQLEPVEVVSKNGVHTFLVELANTDETRARGLMFRRELAPDRGMLFDFFRDQEVGFWMQNTYVSLDMIFIRSDGTIHRIAENTTPLSTQMVPSGGPVRAVLEVVAGTSRRLGIAPGDKVGHRIFSGR